MTILSINANYSTTRRLSDAKPKIPQSSDTKFERLLLLPQHPQRKGEGGLRRQGSFKASDSDCGDDSKHPLITVITVVFNGAATLEKSILSVINQTYDNVEYIIIDGGSTDGTVDIIRQFEYAIDYWVSEPDAGIYDAWNKALVCASGSWICFMGADDYLWDVNVLSDMVPAMLMAKSSIRIVYGSIAIVNSREQVISHVGEPWEASKKKLTDIMSVPHPGLMHHRSWFEKYGLFDTSYRIAGDYEMLLRGWPVEDALFISDLVIVGMAQGGISSSPENAIKALSETRRAQQIHGIRFPSIRLLAAFAIVYTRLSLQIIFGERGAYRVLDYARKLFGKPPYWTKL